jgi:hypothetical protein
VGAVTTEYYWSAGYEVVNEAEGSDEYLYIGNTLARRHWDGSTAEWAYYFSDHLGSTRMMTDGMYTSTWEYKPYGEVYSSTINGGLTDRDGLRARIQRGRIMYTRTNSRS